MKKSLIRMASIGAVTALLATMAPQLAHAAATPAWDATTDGSVYLVDGTAYTQLAAGTQLAYNTSAGVVLSANPVPADLGDYSWATFPAPTGATADFFPFLSPVGQERTPASWLSWDAATTVGTGASLPSVWPGHFVGHLDPSVKANGGTFSMGIAYTDSDIKGSTHVVKAYYVTVNVDAGGTWTFSAPAVAPTDVATTTTLAPNPTTVEAGQTTVLTANVTASKAVTGNVEFFNGATSLGTVALAGGVATKTATVGSVGSNVFSAKFVQNTVGSDRFLASTSANATVTGTQPAVVLPPNGPAEIGLDAATANGATATYDAATHKATLTVNASNNGKVVNAFGYSVPTYLGQQTVTGGSVSVDVSMLPAGPHKIAIVDPAAPAVVLAWASFTKSDAATPQTFTKTINADVAAATLSDGEFSLTNLSGSVVNLTNPAMVNNKSVVSGVLGQFKVTDLRQASKPGWKLTTDVADFTKNSDTIAKSALGIAPKLVNQAGTGATAPTVGAAQVSGSASYPWNFATLASGFSGVTTYDADLVFSAPTGSPAGTYTSTLTLTLVSN